MWVAVDESTLSWTAGPVEEAGALVAGTDVWRAAAPLAGAMPGSQSAALAGRLAQQLTECLEGLSCDLTLLASSLRCASSRYASADVSAQRTFHLVAAPAVLAVEAAFPCDSRLTDP